MAFAPLILRGNLEINGTDVSEQVTSFKFSGTRETIEIPQTFGARASVAAGSDTYSVEISYLTDIDATALTTIFWAALDDAEGTVEVSGTLKAGAVSATNPSYTATAVVTGAAFGGDVDSVGMDSQTFPLTDRPVKATS